MLGAVLLVYIFFIPGQPFKNVRYSTVVLDKNGELLGARIASDGQWRFPPPEEIPEKYEIALINFEDRYFKWHPGVNPVAIIRAALGNIQAGHITSGGSTITMQVVRMARNKKRTVFQKIIEAVWATKVELSNSKKEIIRMYAAHAPFGGNVVGLEAASWRYFGRPANELSWGEAAALAVLPNSPSILHLGKNRKLLLAKRNRLLEKLSQRGLIDPLTCEAACGEPLPGVPLPLPSHAHHLTERICKKEAGKIIRTGIDIHLQKTVESIVNNWNKELSEKGVLDLAAVVQDVRSGEVIAYVGNANHANKRDGSQVDIAHSPRSTGSILKPLLYCALLQEGEILPYTLLPDIPINLNGFSPQNYDLKFYGAVPAAEALARSLNVPSVHMLRSYGVPKFLNLLKNLGMTTLNRDASDYGLSLILGGAEGSLLDITSIYASLAKTYQETGKKNFPLNDRTALWYTLDALKEVNRPDEIDWRLISSVRKVAWKTGTSYGFRDAWAVGVTPDYAVGVWAGNANGKGSPGLTGAKTSGPVLFDIFNLLPKKEYDYEYASNGWFKEPVYGEYKYGEVCRQSGHLKSMACEQIDTLMLPLRAERSKPCPYHSFVDGKSGFILPPAMEWYYRQHHPEYKPPVSSNYAVMEFIYPERGSTIFIPKQLDGSTEGAVFNLAHRNPEKAVFWHLDNEYMGETKFIHQMSFAPEQGKHTVTVVDETGNTISVSFNIAENRL